MNYAFAGLALFIFALFAGRWVIERASRKLDKKEQALLVSGLSKYRMISLAGVILIVVAYFVFRGMATGDTSSAFGVFAVILVVYMLGTTAFVFFRLKTLKISEHYINAFLAGTAIQYLGLITYFGLSRIQ